VASALIVGVLWGGNIGVLYPFIEMAQENRNLQDWVRGEITKAETRATEQSVRIDQFNRQLAHAAESEQAAVEADIVKAEKRRQAEERAAEWYGVLKPYIDDYIPRDRFQTLVLLIGVVFLSTLVKNLFQVIDTILVSRVAYLGTYELQKLFFKRTLRMDVATFNSEGTSDLMSRFTYDMQNLVAGLNALLGKLIREPLKMAACLIGAGMICWRLLVLSLVVAPLAGYLIGWLAKTLKRANRRAMEEMSQLLGVLTETFQGIKVVKAFTMERQERQRFHRACKKCFQKSMRIARYDSLSRPTIEVMGILIISMAILAGAYLVIEEQTHLFGIQMSARPMEWSSLLLFYGLLIGAADPARKLSDVFTQIQGGSAAAERIFALVDREPAIQDPQSPVPLGRHHLDLAFDQVNFAYHEAHPVLHDVSLRIRFGETLAIVGPSGCGKSTLANLIPRFADPTSGVVRLDGVSIRDARLRDLRSQIGLVTQDPLLFDDTVMNNIRYGSPYATDAEVIEAAKQAHAHRFIENDLADGYETEIGPLGGQLSGGQRQRIALARAILRNPPILILDEATSQVDLESEQLIQRVLEQFVHGRTTIFITHRLSALALADRIVVMRDGRLIDVGTHNELMTRCEFYRRLYQIQFEEMRESA
jgi:ATP-binding cassette subfamily B protein/subfamily B ATP-binding cassette protein MsbA